MTFALLRCESKSGLLTTNTECWPTIHSHVGEHQTTTSWWKVGENRDEFYNLLLTVFQHVVVSYTHANLSLPTRASWPTLFVVCRVKAASLTIVLYCIVLYCIVLYCIVLYCIVLYCIVLYCIVLYCIVLYCIVLYCIVSYQGAKYKLRIATWFNICWAKNERCWIVWDLKISNIWYWIAHFPTLGLDKYSM